MRDIKFRAWDKRYGEMKSPHNLYISGQADEALNMNVHDRCIFMQYTGLKDKNGVEIYEGDIVRAGTVESKDGAVRNMNVPVEYVRGIFEPIAYVTDDALEVIGNIYENGHLLDSK